LENQIRGLAVVFRIRLPRAHHRLHRPGSQSKRGDDRPPCRHAGPDCGTDCHCDGDSCDRHGHETHDKGLGGLSSAPDDPRRWSIDRARLRRPDR
jgi:hypothetical protein